MNQRNWCKTPIVIPNFDVEKLIELVAKNDHFEFDQKLVMKKALELSRERFLQVFTSNNF